MEPDESSCILVASTAYPRSINFRGVRMTVHTGQADINIIIISFDGAMVEGHVSSSDPES
jgi:hypothetical protein